MQRCRHRRRQRAARGFPLHIHPQLRIPDRSMSSTSCPHCTVPVRRSVSQMPRRPVVRRPSKSMSSQRKVTSPCPSSGLRPQVAIELGAADPQHLRRCREVAAAGVDGLPHGRPLDVAQRLGVRARVKSCSAIPPTTLSSELLKPEELTEQSNTMLVQRVTTSKI